MKAADAVKRYGLVQDGLAQNLEEMPNEGEWVTYDDHVAAISAAEERERVLREALRTVEFIKLPEWQHACCPICLRRPHKQGCVIAAALATPAPQPQKKWTPEELKQWELCRHDVLIRDCPICQGERTPAPEQENKPQLQWHSLSDKPPVNERVLLSDPLESTFSSRTPFCGMAHVNSNGVWCIMHNGQSEPIHPSHLHKAMWSPRPYPPAPAQPSEQNGGDNERI